jgi:hypothetical protein
MTCPSSLFNTPIDMILTVELMCYIVAVLDR